MTSESSTYLILESISYLLKTVNGGFAEYCAYPAGRVFKIKNLSDVEATLLEPASCACHGLEKIAPKMGSSVLMFGKMTFLFIYHNNRHG